MKTISYQKTSYTHKYIFLNSTSCQLSFLNFTHWTFKRKKKKQDKYKCNQLEYLAVPIIFLFLTSQLFSFNLHNSNPKLVNNQNY